MITTAVAADEPPEPEPYVDITESVSQTLATGGSITVYRGLGDELGRKTPVPVPVPTVGRIVHYVSYGTAGGEYGSECRAAIVAAVPADVPPSFGPDGSDGPACDLVVLNPGGLFFNRCGQDETTKRAGTWHWPERA